MRAHAKRAWKYACALLRHVGQGFEHLPKQQGQMHSTVGRGGAGSGDDVGAESCLYPSGRVAVTICVTDSGNSHVFTADNDNGQVLAMFDQEGVGSVSHPGGNPWLVVSREGWLLTSPKGDIIKRGSFPRRDPTPISCQASEQLTITFIDRQRIQASLSLQGKERVYQVGEHRKRSEGSHLDKVVKVAPGGKLELDVAAIRKRQAAQGSAFVPKGPHHTMTAPAGMGNLASLISSMRQDSPIKAAIADLDASSSRMKTLFGSSSGSSTAAAADLEGALSDTLGTSKWLQPKKYPTYQPKRAKLPLLSVEAAQARFMGPGAAKDVLCMLCVLGDWNPVCARLETQQLQAGLWELKQEAAANSGSDAAHIQVFKVDASENRTLQERYGFKSVPVFLMFYQDGLVRATNDIRSGQQLKEAALEGLALGRRGETLPEGYRFAAGEDNQMLATITPDMLAV